MSNDHKTTFGTLNPDGTLTNVRIVKQSMFANCPHVIFDLSHYREDGSCKCDDPDERAKMIAEWGYKKKDFKDIPLRQTEPKGE